MDASKSRLTEHFRWVLCVVFFVTGLVASGRAVRAQARRLPDSLALQLQDGTSSPSDRVIQHMTQDQAGDPPTPAIDQSPSTGIRLGISDLGESAGTLGNSSRQAPAPRATPRVASLGRNNNYTGLVSTRPYVSPLASLAGMGGGSSAANQYFGSSGHRSLLQTPEMFGDFRRPGSAITFDSTGSGHGNNDKVRPTDFPSAASYSGMRISENNYALPQDRIWFGYNHYHNAFAQPGGDLSLDRFLLGFEKTFFGGNTSVEVRLPLAGSMDPSGSFGGSTVYAGGSFGNLSAILKRVLYANESCALAIGLGVEAPTGSQSHASDTANGLVAISIDPNAVYLTPYLGAMRRFDDTWFANGFIQVDFPTSGDNLVATIGNGAPQTFKLNQPTMLEIDLGLGAWLLAPDRYNPTGIALTSELHIATALSDADTFTVAPALTLPNVFVNESESIRTILNSTTGLQATLRNGWSVRTGIAVPLLVDRIFDTEVLVQVNRRL